MTKLLSEQELRSKLVDFAATWETPFSRMKTLSKPLTAQINVIRDEMLQEIVDLIRQEQRALLDRVQDELEPDLFGHDFERLKSVLQAERDKLV